MPPEKHANALIKIRVATFIMLVLDGTGLVKWNGQAK